MKVQAKKVAYGCVGTLVGGLALASVARTAQADGDRPPLPPEAYTACESKAAGDACVAHVHGADLDGTCVVDHGGSRLFCRPSQPPPPPPEAFDACSGKKESDACSVTFGQHEVQGVCRATPDGRLACAPAHPPDGQ